jgi:hypothetical protein
MRAYEWDGEANYIICNYEAVVNDWDLIKDAKWGAIFCDEATAIKMIDTFMNTAFEGGRHEGRVRKIAC